MLAAGTWRILSHFRAFLSDALPGSSLRLGAILGAASALSQAAFSDLRGTSSVSLPWNAVSHFFPKSFPFF